VGDDVGPNEGDALVLGLEEMLGPEDLLGDALVLGLEEMLGAFVAAETCFDSMQKTEDGEFRTHGILVKVTN
jgi:hypothetical protein